MMRNLIPLLVMALPMWLASCASQEEMAMVQPDNDPRVGDEVKKVCFARNIDSWNDVDNDRNAVILKMKNRDYYKLKLSGGCDPQWAMMNLAVITRGSSCYSRGDRVKTDGDPFRGYGSACVITQINKWDPEAVKKPEQQTKAKQ